MYIFLVWKNMPEWLFNYFFHLHFQQYFTIDYLFTVILKLKYIYSIWKAFYQCWVYCNEIQNSKRVAWYLLILTIYVIWNMKQKLWYHTGIYFYRYQNWYNMAVKLQLLNQVSARARYLICMHDTREKEINLAEYNQYISNGKQQSK